MHSFPSRRLLDHKQSFLGAWEVLSSQIPLPLFGACSTAGGAVRSAGSSAPSSPQERKPHERKPPDSITGQHKPAAQSDVRVRQSPALERLIQSIPVTEDRSAFPLGLYSAASGNDTVTMALQCGASLSGQSMSMFQGAMSSTEYPECSEEDQMYPAGVMEDVQTEILRRNNISMPCKKNQRVYGTVYAVDRKRVWVDVGHTSSAQLSRSVRFPLLIESFTADVNTL